MPESKSRAGRKKTTPPAKRTAPKSTKQTPRWWVPVMLALMIIGLIWVVVTYMTQSGYPIPALSSWNLLVGFGLMVVGFIMTMGWR